MRILIYLEPLWFRGSATFLGGHVEQFILPILRSLSGHSSHLQICIVSNVILSLEFLSKLSTANIRISSASAFTINSTHALADCDFRTDVYAADLLRAPKPIDLSLFRMQGGNRLLSKRILQAFQEFNPDIAVTTTQNRYVRQCCDKISIPLLSCEFGPLPRAPYPLSRFLSLDGHLSDGPFSSAKNLRRTLKKRAANKSDGAYLAKFLEKYHSAISKHEQYNACQDAIKRAACEGSVSMLALQPEDWLTWEGTLTHSQGPAQIILRALGEMSTDRLIVTFHPAPQGHVVGNQFSEIWLSNPALLRLPPTIDVNTSEIFLPFVDEVLTVSSNVAMSAFLLGKRIRALGGSFVKTLAELTSNGGASVELREEVAQYLHESYCVPDDVFSSPRDLQALIHAKVEEKFGSSRLEYASSLSERTTIVDSQDSLECIHDKIKAHLRQSGPSFSADFLSSFGRHAIGYMVPNGAIGAELGVAAAAFSDSLLMSGSFEKLYSVDSWGDHHDDAEFYAASKRLQKYGERSVVLRKSFDEALSVIPDAHLDFIYIDAYAHTGAAAHILKKWMPKLKDGALIAGHDFCKINWPMNYQRLTEALNALKTENLTLVPGILTFNQDDIFPSFLASKSAIC